MEHLLLEIALLCLYGFISVCLLRYYSFYTNSGISFKKLQFALYTKWFAAFIYGYWHYHNHVGADTLSYFEQGEKIYQLLQQGNIKSFCRLVFGKATGAMPIQEAHFIKTATTYWNDPNSWYMLRINALLHIISGGFFSVHHLWFSFAAFTGLVALYRFFNSLFNNRAAYLYPCIFFMPSNLFWSAGVHKEAVCIFYMGLILYNMYCLSVENKQKLTKPLTAQKTILHLLFIILPAILLYMIRNYVFALFVLPISLGFLARTFSNPKESPFKSLTIFSLTCGIVMLLLPLIDTHLLAGRFINKLNYLHWFFNEYLSGASQFKQIPWSGTWSGVIQQLPQAFFNSTIRPLPSNWANTFSIIAGLEAIAISILGTTAIIWNRWKAMPHKYWWLSLATYSISHLLLIGLIVGNTGTLVRYRSLPLLFVSILSILLIKRLPKLPQIFK